MSWSSKPYSMEESNSFGAVIIGKRNTGKTGCLILPTDINL